MNDTVLEEVEEIKDLGVHYDTLLLFDKHVSAWKGKESLLNVGYN